MNTQKIKLLLEASKKGKTELQKSIDEFFNDIKIIDVLNGRIEFTYNSKKYRIAYDKEGLKRNYIEYQNYKKLAYKYDSTQQRIISTKNKPYLEILEILNNTSSENLLIKLIEGVQMKELDDIRIIATKEGYHEELSIISNSENNYLKLKRAINQLQNNSIIGKIKKQSFNYYSNAILLNEFSNLFFIEKTLKIENSRVLHFDLEDFLLNGEDLNWEPKYTEGYFGSHSMSIETITEYLNCKATLENDFENLYRGKNLEESYYNNYQEDKSSNFDYSQNYNQDFSQNSDGFGINWNQS